MSFAMVVRTGKNPIFLRAIGRMFAPETEYLEDRFRKRQRGRIGPPQEFASHSRWLCRNVYT